MRKIAVVALGCALLGSTLLAAQTQSSASSRKIEALFKAAEIPFTSSEEGSYVAVITVEEGESDRFHVYLSVVLSNAILYTSSEWVYRTDADTIAQDAVLGHFVSKDLRKEAAPYLKQ